MLDEITSLDEQPRSTAEFMRCLGLTLTLRPVPLDDGPDRLEAWTCVLSRQDGETYEIKGATFVAYEEDAEWQVEPTPSAILGLLRTTDAADADPGWVDAWNGGGDGTGRSLRAFLGEAGHGMLRPLPQE